MKGGAVSERSSRFKSLAMVRNPLVFFALALLIIEGIFGLVVTFSQMTGDQQFYSLLVMALLFLVVVGVVAFITVKTPQNLYEDVVDKLEVLEYIEEWVNGPGFADAVIEVVESKAVAAYGGSNRKAPDDPTTEHDDADNAAPS